MDLDSKIDDLYRLPQSEFTAARNALAKTLTGDAAKRVKGLTKPTLVPWAVNQLYWKSKPIYERLMKSGDALRGAQIAALTGRTTALPRASEAHKKVLAEAVREATKIAAAEAVNPGAEELARTLEALSLAPARPQPRGRLTELVQPAGFEALAGVSGLKSAKTLKVERAAEVERERETARQRKEAEDKLKAAEHTLERTSAAEARARDAFESAQEDRDAAEAALAAARKAKSQV